MKYVPDTKKLIEPKDINIQKAYVEKPRFVS